MLRVLAPSLLCSVLLVGCANPSPSPSAPVVSADTSPQPRPGTAEPSLTSTASASRPRFFVAANLPIRGSAREIGRQILIAPGPDGALFVSIPRPGGAVLVLLDRSGQTRPGWPIALDDSTSCGLLLPVEDGSVRAVCDATDLPLPEGDAADERAFGFDAGGRMMAGWPVQLRHRITGRMVGDELTVLAEEWLTDTVTNGEVSHEAWVMSVAADGSIRSGAKVPMVETCCEEWAVGPDGIAYGTIGNLNDDPTTETSDVFAVSIAGVVAGFPVAIDGNASGPAFDAAGRIHLIVGTPFERPARTLVFAPDGRAVDAGSGELQIAATSEFLGIEGTEHTPLAPLVGPDGATFVIALVGGTTTVAGVSPSGKFMAGWPYRSEAGPQPTGVCPDGPDGLCEGFFWATPTIGPDNVLYLLHAAANSSAGGSVVAVGTDGRVAAGWPVGLRRPGAEFWSIVVGSDGTAYALAIEPETGDGSSASILAIASDSTVLYRTTIVDP